MILAPEVDFYGEPLAWPASEFVHSERLVERSQFHDWKIRPHRHNDFAQIFLVLKGKGRACLDSSWHDVVSPCLLVIPERVVHEFEWDRDSDGYVLSVQLSLIKLISKDMKTIPAAFTNPAIADISTSRRFICSLFAEIHSETTNRTQFKDDSIESLVRLLGIWLLRNSKPTSSASRSPGRARKHFNRFEGLVDEHFRSHWSVADYAGSVGITPAHLGTVCRKTVGKSALDVIHAHLLLAARRELVYTEKNIAGIAHYLGFTDPSYFTRFFKRATGITPSEFRRRSGTFDHGVSQRL